MTTSTDRYEPVDKADRWIIDIIKTVEPPGFMVFEEVDMTATQDIIARLRARSVKVTYTHVIARASALALSRHPELVRIMLGRKKVAYPDTIDLSLSVSSDLSLSAEPTLIVQDAGRKNLLQITEEITEKAAEVRAAFAGEREQARRFMRVIPFAFVRRWLVRKMKSRMSMVRENLGIFHISSVPRMQFAIPLICPGTGALCITRVEDRVVARNGKPVVLPTTRLGLIGDHRVWKGTEASIFINEITKILEEGELAAEIPTNGSEVPAAGDALSSTVGS
jgi:pyruvate/2-oxoglutarate dehydrogenase complex dihydrolipoamide acyltransferase (E2) component